MSINIKQAEDILELISRTDESEKRNLLQVEFAGKLLDWAENDKLSFSSLAESEVLIDYFLKYQRLATSCNSFFSDALPHLNEGKDYEEQIKTLNNRLSETLSKKAEMSSIYSELKEKNEKLKKESESAAFLEKEINDLEELQKRVSPENIKHLEARVQDLKKETDEKKPLLEKLEGEKIEFETIQEVLDKKLNILKNETSLAKLVETSRALSELIDKETVNNDLKCEGELKRLGRKNRDYLEITKKLDACLNELKEVTLAEKENHDLFTEHFSANVNINDTIENNEDNVLGPIEDKKGGLAKLRENIKPLLTEYDQTLKEVIHAYEDCTKNIRRLNSPGKN